MKVLVLGGGVVGVTSAYFLARAGAQVTLLERASGPAQETSFGNGGQISAAHAEPWASPHTLRKALTWLGRDDAPLLLRPRLDPALLVWMARFLGNCLPHRTEINTERTLRIAVYSRHVLGTLRAEENLDYHQQTKGILHFYRNPKSFHMALEAAAVMRQHGLERHPLDRDACVALEPALKPMAFQIQGGLHSPADESGDSHIFTQQLAERAAQRGVTLSYGETIRRLRLSGGRVCGVETAQGSYDADTVVLCLGSYSPLMVKSLGLRLPIYPAKGYSVTLRLTDPARAPTLSLTDDENKMVFSRFGDRLRAAGTAEFAGWDTSLNRYRAELVRDKALALFPDCGTVEEPLWAGLRAVTPDSVPLIGATPLPGLFLNTGHGTLGWTMACGSAKLTADLLTGATPEIDPAGLGLERFS